MVVFSWPLAFLFFSPFSFSQEVGGKETLFHSFLPPPFYNLIPFLYSNSNIHQQPPEQNIEKGMATIPFLKSLFWNKTPESDEIFASPSENLVHNNPLKPL